MSDAPEDDGLPVVKLPRGRGIKFSGPEMFRIVMMAGLLIAVIMLTKPCSQAVSHFVTDFDKKGSGAIAKPGRVDLPGSAAPAGSAAPTAPLAGSDYEVLRPGMTDDEVKAAIERAKAKSAGSTQ